MTNADSRINVFAAAVENDLRNKAAAEAGAQVMQTPVIQPKPVSQLVEKTYSNPAIAEIQSALRNEKVAYTEQMNVRVRRDIKAALKLATVTRKKKLVEIFDDALRTYLADEIDMLHEEGIL